MAAAGPSLPLVVLAIDPHRSSAGISHAAVHRGGREAPGCISVRCDRDETAPCVIAGPTCDSVDVLYQKSPYPLPVSLAIGDKVLIEAAGAYTATYSSIGFNGFPPLRQYVI